MSDETTRQDDAEMSLALNGSVREPAAWGVRRVGSSWVSILANKAQAETSRKYFGKMESWVHEIVPLYRSPTLTDAEREAIERLCEATNDMIDDDKRAGGCHWQDDAAAVAAARGLLERTKGGGG